MAHWKLKSESDTEQVYAHVSHGDETGRYRYAFVDGRTVEVGTAGLHGDQAAARHPARTRANLAIGASILAGTVALVDIGSHLFR